MPRLTLQLLRRFQKLRNDYTCRCTQTSCRVRSGGKARSAELSPDMWAARLPSAVFMSKPDYAELADCSAGVIQQAY